MNHCIDRIRIRWDFLDVKMQKLEEANEETKIFMNSSRARQLKMEELLLQGEKAVETLQSFIDKRKRDD